MFSILFISGEKGEQASLFQELLQYSFNISSVSCEEIENGELPAVTPDMIILEVSASSPTPRSLNLINRLKKKSALPVLAITNKEDMKSLMTLNRIDDFVIAPYQTDELILRIKRLLQKVKNIESGDLFKCDGLTIDLVKYEVTLENRVIELTFKEYELLLYLASNRGRVFTREALLNKVWGFDYFGGDRTVDVHIRRLRSKIEDSDHTFIETVRNIGYRFKKGTDK
jgi:DNA-binding response OmpR family regulator